MKKALIVIDYQFDFADPKGSLYVKKSECLKKYILDKISIYKKEDNLVIATMDWHPSNHSSFVKWPIHCVQNSSGANLLIEESNFDHIIKKGIEHDYESYSAFYSDSGKSNGLHEILKRNKIKNIELVGVALDICVNATFNHAIRLGYNVKIDLNGCQGIKNIIEYS